MKTTVSNKANGKTKRNSPTKRFEMPKELASIIAGKADRYYQAMVKTKLAEDQISAGLKLLDGAVAAALGKSVEDSLWCDSMLLSIVHDVETMAHTMAEQLAGLSSAFVDHQLGNRKNLNACKSVAELTAARISGLAGRFKEHGLPSPRSGSKLYADNLCEAGVVELLYLASSAIDQLIEGDAPANVRDAWKTELLRREQRSSLNHGLTAAA